MPRSKYRVQTKSGPKAKHDPDKVVKLALSHGVPAAAERYGYDKSTVTNLVSAYRAKHPELPTRNLDPLFRHSRAALGSKKAS